METGVASSRATPSRSPHCEGSAFGQLAVAVCKHPLIHSHSFVGFRDEF